MANKNTIFTADKQEFNYRLHTLWYNMLDTATNYAHLDGLAPSLCADAEVERRKHEVVKYLVMLDAQGTNLAATTDQTLCDTFFPAS